MNEKKQRNKPFHSLRYAFYFLKDTSENKQRTKEKEKENFKK